MSDAGSWSPPSTPVTTDTVIHWPSTPRAPKKPKVKILEFLQPTVYSPKSEPKIEKPTKAQEKILDALSRAGIRKPSPPKEEKRPAVQYPPPRKLTISIIDARTEHVIHKYVPSHRLTRVSAHAASVLEPRPWAGRYKIYGKYDTNAITNVVNAITLSNPAPLAAELSENLLTYEASRRLGIQPSHAFLKPLVSTINDHISREPVMNEVLGFITYRLGSHDPVFKHTANVLCHQRFKGEVGDVQAFEKMIRRRPALQRAMVQIDRQHKERRAVVNASKHASQTIEMPEDGQEKKLEQDAVAEGLEAVLGEKGGFEVEKQREKLLKIFRGEKNSNPEEILSETKGYEQAEKTEKV